MASRLIAFRSFGRRLAMPARGLLLCLVAGALFFNLRGIGETLTPWSQATVSLLANLYYEEDGRDQITVLLFREQDLTSLGEIDAGSGKKIRLPFPVPYTTHIETLNILADWKPRALFIDFAFIDKRAGDDVDELYRTLCKLQEGGTRVYLASFYYWQPHHGLRDDLFVDGRGQAREPCFAVVPVNYKPDKNGMAQTYDLLQAPAKQAPTASAALRIYADTPGPRPRPADKPIRLADYSQSMDVLWGSLPPRPRRSDTPCAAVSLVDSAIRLAKDGPDGLKRDCPYSNTLSVFSLWNESSDDVEALLKDKVVLYGAAFLGTDDWLRSPVHGNIPGVYLHAMALDNLFNFGDGYKRVGDHSLKASASPELLVDLAMIVLGVLWHLLVVRFRNELAAGAAAGSVPYHFWQFCLLALPYLLLSLALARSLQLVGSPLAGVAQLLLLTLLLAVAGRSLLKRQSYILPASLAPAAAWLRDAFIDKSWIVLMAILCGLAFYQLDLGPRNFWAFAAFIGFTHLIDGRLGTLAQQIHKRRLGSLVRQKHRRHRRSALAGLAVGVLAIAAGIVPFLPDASARLANWAIAGGLALAALAAIFLLLCILPWLYRHDISSPHPSSEEKPT